VSGKGLDALDRVIRARAGRKGSARSTSSRAAPPKGVRRRMKRSKSRSALDGLDNAFDNFYMERKNFFAAKASDRESTPGKSASVDPEMIEEIKVQLEEEMNNDEYLSNVLTPEMYMKVKGLRDAIRKEKEDTEKSKTNKKTANKPTDGGFPKMGGASGQDAPSFYIISGEDNEPEKKGDEHDP
jgi:hypothetical protein